jgi:hypothetical protein
LRILDKVATIRGMIDPEDLTVSTTQTGDMVRRVVTFSYLTHNMDARIL